MEHTSFSDRFDELASAHGSRLAVREKDRGWSYGDALARSRELSDCLASLGVSKGRCVALMVPNSGAFVSSFLGIARVGGSVAPFNVRYRRQELVYYLEDTDAAALVVASDLLPVAQEALQHLDRSPTLIEVSPDGGCRAVRRGDVRSAPEAPDDRDTPLLHQYTSGSTGAPKRIIRTNAMLLAELGRLAGAFQLTEEDRFLGAAPFSHVNGLVRTMMTSMYVGGTLYPLSQFQRRPVLDLITAERITYFGGVPYMYAILAATPVRGETDLSSLRVAFSASAPLLSDDNRRFAEKYGPYVRQLYGSTETGTISVNLHPDVEDRLESVGLPLEGIRIEIWDEGGAPLPPGEEGEIVIASPHAITSYDGNPEATAESFRGGFYLSGDLGRKDEQGYLTLTGRKKFLINRGGYKVNPLEVEQAIQSHPKIQEVVVLGAPSRFGDEVVRCVAVTHEPCTEEEIIEHCRERIADFKIPSLIEFREELPKSQTGKILRHEL
jgi:long-chain acyl-CoA synthetase